MPPSSNHDSVTAEPDASSRHTVGSVTSAAEAASITKRPTANVEATITKLSGVL
jgi:hypothetical protein